MIELTDNQDKVVQAIIAGHHTIDSLVEATNMSKSSVSGTITSLIKKEIITKDENGSYSVNHEEIEIDTENGGAVSEEEHAATPIAVLIPYRKDEAAGEELKFALRALEQNLKEDFRVVIVGDKEDWFSPEITHIPLAPHLIKEECNCPTPAMIRDPQADVTYKVFTAIASGEIEGDFILTNDDIFLLGATYLADIAVLKAFGNLDKGGKSGGIYNKNVKRTAKALEGNQLPTHRYGTHTPMLLNSDKVLQVIEKYNALEKGFLLTSLYFNEVYPDARPIQVDGTAKDPILGSAYRPDIGKDILNAVFSKRKFLNCDTKGWNAVKPIVETVFSKPSRYEK